MTSQSMKLSDYVADFVAQLGVKQVFAVSGGGAMHLVDSVGSHPELEYVATHHEQAAAMAAEAYSRIHGFAAALVTTGPGGTNAITGVAGAWVDSIPTLFISGQVTRDSLSAGHGLRQFGIQEIDITALVKSITKYAVTLRDENDIRYELEKAYAIATSGRPGPVWIDIPLDIQSKQINPEQMRGYTQETTLNRLQSQTLDGQAALCMDMLREAKRPVLILGYGVRLAGAQNRVLALVEHLKMPVLSSWTASDMIASDHGRYVGRFGLFGDRASNFTVQNADTLLVLGSRLSIPQAGYNPRAFARAARIIMVDIDASEFRKPSLHVDLPIQADVREMIDRLLALDALQQSAAQHDWSERTQHWKNRYPTVLPEYQQLKQGVNSFYFINQLSLHASSDATIVADIGANSTCTMQTFETKLGQRLMMSGGLGSMGYSLPGAIGACYAQGKKPTICIIGDGALQMNIQELQTVRHNNLPVLLFVFNNGGYLAIKLMQQNHFGRYVGSEKSSGVSCPDIKKIAAAYDISYQSISNHIELQHKLPAMLNTAEPLICEVFMPEDQAVIPRCSSLKRPDGSIASKPLEDMLPFLDREEFLENMIIPPLDELD